MAAKTAALSQGLYIESCQTLAKDMKDLARVVTTSLNNKGRSITPLSSDNPLESLHSPVSPIGAGAGAGLSPGGDTI